MLECVLTMQINIYDGKSLSMESWQGWLFHKVGPAFEAIGKVIPRMVEAGMFGHWERKTW